MSLKLKRNLPLILSLLAVVLVLTLFFGNLRVGAMNIHGGTWEELRVTVSAAGSSVLAEDASFSAVQTAGDTSVDILQAVQPVNFEQQAIEGN